MSRESRERLRAALERRRFKEALIERLQRLRTDWVWEKASFGEAPLSKRISCDANYLRYQFEFDDLFEDLLAGLPAPKPVTVSDLRSAAFNQFAGISSDTAALERAHTRFVEHVLWLLEDATVWIGGYGDNVLGDWSQAVSEPFDFGRWAPPADEASTESWDSHFYTLWDSESESGFSFVVDWDSVQRIRGYLVGEASTDAFEAADREFRLLIPPVLRSFGILASAVSMPGSNSPLPWIELFKQSFIDEIESDDRQLSYPALTSDPGTLFFSECISGYFVAPKKKATMEQRIGNAVRLLFEADSQRSSTIGLALCFAAIEALVCTKTEGITDELSRNVATALEPDRSRRKAAIDATKSLYDKRSKALHGKFIEEDDSARRKTRCLAAGVLGAAIEWRCYQHRMGDKEEQTEFVEHLKRNVSTGLRQLLVEISVARQL